MSPQDIWTNIYICLGTGIITGLVSGVCVTCFVKKNDIKRQVIVNFERDRYAYYEYLRSLKIELEILLETGDYTHLIRKLENPVVVESFGNEDLLTEESKESLDFAYKVQKSLRNLIDTKEEKSAKIKMVLSELIQASYKILKIKIKEK